MIEIEIYATLIISIFGIAFPIILQAISRLDTSYSSSLTTELFENEPIKKWFQKQLYISLIILFFWSLKLEPIEPLQKIGFIVNNSAELLVVITSIALVISFILLVKKIFIYHIPSRFVQYLIRKHNEKR